MRTGNWLPIFFVEQCLLLIWLGNHRLMHKCNNNNLKPSTDLAIFLNSRQTWFFSLSVIGACWCECLAVLVYRLSLKIWNNKWYEKANYFPAYQNKSEEGIKRDRIGKWENLKYFLNSWTPVGRQLSRKAFVVKPLKQLVHCK